MACAGEEGRVAVYILLLHITSGVTLMFIGLFKASSYVRQSSNSVSNSTLPVRNITSTNESD